MALQKSSKPNKQVEKKEIITVANAQVNAASSLFMMRAVPPIRPLWVLTVPLDSTTDQAQTQQHPQQAQLRSVSVVRESPGQPVSVLSKPAKTDPEALAKRLDALSGPPVLP